MYVNGQTRQGNNFQLEGLDNNWDDGNVTVLVPPIEALATVDVSTSNFDAEFGRRHRRCHQRDSALGHKRHAWQLLRVQPR